MNIRQHLYKIDCAAFLFLIILIRIPATIAPSLEGISLALLAFVLISVIIKNIVLCLTYTPGQFAITKSNSSVLIAITLFWVLICISYIRGLNNGASNFQSTLYPIFLWSAMLIMAVLSFLVPDHWDKQEALKKAISYSIGSYIVLNVVLYFLNISYFDSNVRFAESYKGVDDIGHSVLLSYFGVYLDRVLFPLAAGVNGMGPITGAAILIGISIITNHISNQSQAQQRSRALLFGTILTLSSIFILLCIDSRFTLFSVIFTIITIKFLPQRFLKRTITTTMVMTPLLPYIIPYVAKIVDNLSILTSLSRHSNDVISLNSRVYVWESAARLLSQILPQHLIGYGFRSQQVPANAVYLYRFTQFNNPELHNYSLQYIFDTGYIGLAIFIILYIIILNHLFQGNEFNENIWLITILTHFAVISTVETAITYYNQEVFAVLLLIFAACLPNVKVEYWYVMKPSTNFAHVLTKEAHSSYF